MREKVRARDAVKAAALFPIVLLWIITAEIAYQLERFVDWSDRQ